MPFLRPRKQQSLANQIKQCGLVRSSEDPGVRESGHIVSCNAVYDDGTHDVGMYWDGRQLKYSKHCKIHGHDALLEL